MADIISLVKMFLKGDKFCLKTSIFQLLAAHLRELAKSLNNFLHGQNVSDNFVTKLPYYFQVCYNIT